MRGTLWIGAFAVTLIASSRGLGAEPSGCQPAQDYYLHHLRPAGGWHPYGDGLLHWWKPNCFPHASAPNDYCRKPLPRTCWPGYPSYYIWAPAAIGHPPCTSPPDCVKPH